MVRRVVSVARFALVLGVVLSVYVVVATRQRELRELERERAELTARVRAHQASAALTPHDLGAVPRFETWLARLGAPDFHEEIADELRARPSPPSPSPTATSAGPSPLAMTLEGPLVYVRGPVDGFGGSAKVAETAAASAKDALLLCLLEPPAARTEKVLVEKVRTAYARGAELEARTANARRLHEVVVGLPLLAPPWVERVRLAGDRVELAQLRRDLERAPIERARAAAKADLLLAVLDEPGDGPDPTELDGERPHVVRVALVDVRQSRTLLALRRRVDPSWVSLARRPTQASGFDSCALAFDVHEALRSPQ